jgi:hypothetical protein
MAGTWISATLASSDYHGQNSDVGNFGQMRLLWPELCQLWAWNLFGHFFFQQERIGWWYLLVEKAMAMRHVILTKRETHVGVGREIAWAQDEKMWKDEKTQKKKKKKNWHMMAICGHFDFGYNWRCKRISEQKKKKEEKFA